MVPQNYIYFGVLHFIFVGSVLSFPLLRRPNVSLVLGIGILNLYWFDWVSSIWPFGPIRHLLPDYTNDYVPIVPWLGVIFIGIWLAYQSWFIRDPLSFLQNKRWLYWPGKHSLAIYLIHQPLFFGIFYLVGFLL
jgi:uncharacterized membrane protein